MDIFETLGIDKNLDSVKEKIKELIGNEKLSPVKEILEKLDAGKITEIINQFEPSIAKILYALLPDGMAKIILEKLTPSIKSEVDKIDQNFLDDINKKVQNSNILGDTLDKAKDMLGGIFK